MHPNAAAPLFLTVFAAHKTKATNWQAWCRKLGRKKERKRLLFHFCFQRCHRPRVNVFRRNCKICTKFLMTFIFRESIDMHRVFVSNKKRINFRGAIERPASQNVSKTQISAKANQSNIKLQKNGTQKKSIKGRKEGI